MLDPVLVALGFLVGATVGLTGVGSGTLLTPLLILVAGSRPALAIGTSLAFAVVTKLAGTWQHARHGAVDGRLCLRLACGSVPGALLGARLVDLLEAADAAQADARLGLALGLALLAAAGASLLRAAGWSWSVSRGARPGGLGAAGLGLGIGLLVGLTSVGAGSLLTAALTLLYGLPAARLVGTVVAHGLLLDVAAATAHGLSGRVEPLLVSQLLLGSVPGVLLGSWLCGRLPARPLRVGIAVMLALAGARLARLL
jgi:uncharacterized membrane protein YfcA